MSHEQRSRIAGLPVTATKAAIGAARTLVASRCLECDWAGSTLDDARGHARQTPHTAFRTVTQVLSAAGRLTGEMVEVHQF